MRKLKLELADLEVTSFDMDRVKPERLGTVVAHKLPAPTTLDPTCGEYTCDQYANTCNYYTCAESCYGTCYDSVCPSWPRTGCVACLA